MLADGYNLHYGARSIKHEVRLCWVLGGHQDPQVPPMGSVCGSMCVAGPWMGAHVGPKGQTWGGEPAVGPCWCPSNGRGCNRGSQGLSMGCSTNGCMLVAFQWGRVHPWVLRAKCGVERQWWLHAGDLPVEEGAPMGPLWCSSHRRRCTHGSHELSTGWSNHGSTLVSFQWKRVHPWVPRGKH